MHASGNEMNELKAPLLNESTQSESIKQHTQNDIVYILLFMNPQSGSNEAQQYVDLEIEKIDIILGDKTKDQQIKSIVYLFNILDKNQRQKGIGYIKELEVIACGGDGTNMWILQEMIGNGINLQKVALGTIPLGTGNDFANSLGWGTQPHQYFLQGLKGLKQLLYYYAIANIQNFDIWNVELEMYENGHIDQIKRENGQASRVILKDKNNQPLKYLSKVMSNYCSFGIDARIGLGFDKSRTNSQNLNKFVYCWEGFKKLFVKTPPVKGVLESVEIANTRKSRIIKREIIDQKQVDFDIEEINKREDEILFTTRSTIDLKKIQKFNSQKHQNISKLFGNPACLLILNIPSYAGGMNPWLTDKTGLKESGIGQWKQQDFGDGKIEFITFDSVISLATEIILKGQGRRCAQGAGPYNVKFKEPEPLNHIDTYWNIDGEYFYLTNPKELRIKLDSKFNNLFKVLVAPQSFTK